MAHRQPRQSAATDRPMFDQIELPLSVAICAWCRPGAPRTGTVSHGICPRHLRKLQGQLQAGPTVTPPRRPRRAAQPTGPWLPLPPAG